MFFLDSTKAMVRGKFHQNVLRVMEKDALGVAALRLQNANPGSLLASEDLIREANNILPEPGNPDAIRLFFSTQHQIQDGPLDDTRDLGRFISERAPHVEGLATAELAGSDSLPQWIEVLADLADAYSYVIEAANYLQDKGMVAVRRATELQALTTRPDDETHFAQAQLFDKASALYELRKAEGKPALHEQYR